MIDKTNITLTNTKLALGIITPLIGVLFFFFSLQTDIKANAQDIKDNKLSIESLEDKVDDIAINVHGLRTDVAVLINQMNTLNKAVERIEKRLEVK